MIPVFCVWMPLPPLFVRLRVHDVDGRVPGVGDDAVARRHDEAVAAEDAAVDVDAGVRTDLEAVLTAAGDLDVDEAGASDAAAAGRGREDDAVVVGVLDHRVVHVEIRLDGRLERDPVRPEVLDDAGVHGERSPELKMIAVVPGNDDWLMPLMRRLRRMMRSVAPALMVTPLVLLARIDATWPPPPSSVIEWPIVMVPKPPGSSASISPPTAVLEYAPGKVLHGAVRLHGLASSPTSGHPGPRRLGLSRRRHRGQTQRDSEEHEEKATSHSPGLLRQIRRPTNWTGGADAFAALLGYPSRLGKTTNVLFELTRASRVHRAIKLYGRGGSRARAE